MFVVAQNVKSDEVQSTFGSFTGNLTYPQGIVVDSVFVDLEEDGSFICTVFEKEHYMSLIAAKIVSVHCTLYLTKHNTLLLEITDKGEFKV